MLGMVEGQTPLSRWKSSRDLRAIESEEAEASLSCT